MIVYKVDVYVKPEMVDEFIEATEANHLATRQEPGNIRFDVLKFEEDPTRFLLYEVYDSEEAVKAHKETEHYFAWRRTVEDMMSRPREGHKFTPLFPQTLEEWKS